MAVTITTTSSRIPVSFEQISQIFLVTPFVQFEQVNVSWVYIIKNPPKKCNLGTISGVYPIFQVFTEKVRKIQPQIKFIAWCKRKLFKIVT